MFMFAVDWDGTCTKGIWPEQGDWLPDAVMALRELDSMGKVVIYSCRVSDYELDDGFQWRVRRDPMVVKSEIAGIQKMLDAEGLGHIEIWLRDFKPPALVYIDDKAIPFAGNWPFVLEWVQDRIKKAEDREVDPFEEWSKSRKTGYATGVFTGDPPPGSILQFDVGCHPVLTGDIPVPSRHPNSTRFHEILGELGELHDRKQADYGRGDDPFANVRASEEWGVPSWVGALVRLNDKVRRLQNFAQKGELRNESAEDSLRDIAVYAIISLVLYEQEGG